jgi:HNH endonuclease
VITTLRLHQCLIYDSETGALFWRARQAIEFKSGQQWKTWNTRYAGKRAGCLDKDGYRIITVDGRHYRAARIIWQMMTGERPPHEVDHKSTDPADDCWDNLRLATSAQNKANAKQRSHSTNSFKGVRKARGGRYEAWIGGGPTRRYLGTFDTPEEAHAAYMAAAREVYGEFARAQ